jgi:hypothetical protein
MIMDNAWAVIYRKITICKRHAMLGDNLVNLRRQIWDTMP